MSEPLLASTWQGGVLPPTDWVGLPEESAAPPPPRPEAAATNPAWTPTPERLLEAVLFVAPEPVTPAEAAQAIRGLSPAHFQELIEGLNRTYRRQGRPYTIERRDAGYRLALRPRHRPVLEKLYGGVKEARLTPAAVETLAVVAFRQPVTKTEVDSLRGQEAGPVLRQLLKRGLIALRQGASADGIATPALAEGYYETTPRFLELFNLTSLDDLPRVDDLDRL